MNKKLKIYIDKSLIEVWEMKDDVQKEYMESPYINYLEYLENSIKGIKEKDHIKTKKNNVEQGNYKNSMQLNQIFIFNIT